jgi:polypeptide N-acetylgalactosaminyltransferase
LSGASFLQTFDWALNHYWEDEFSVQQIKALTGGNDDRPNADESPITMGMFGTSKRWWLEIGGMDRELSTWGGENIEISLRTWLCGGQILVARGSRIDHVYRLKFPYKVDTGQYQRNLGRIARAWMGDYGVEKFYNHSHIARHSIQYGSLVEQASTQKRLKCHPFSWYQKKFTNRAPLDEKPLAYRQAEEAEKATPAP